MGTKTWASLKPKLKAATQMQSDPKVKQFGANLDAIENSALVVCKSLQMAEGSHTLKFTMADKEILDCPIEATNGYQKFALEFSLPQEVKVDKMSWLKDSESKSFMGKLFR